MNYFEKLNSSPILPVGQRMTASDLIAEAEAMADLSEKNMRGDAMASVVEWVNDGDFTYQALADIVLDDAETDEDGNVTDEEESGYYDDMFDAVWDAILALGGDSFDDDMVSALIEDEDDEMGKKIGSRIKALMEKESLTDSDITAKYAASGKIMESTSVGIFEAGGYPRTDGETYVKVTDGEKVTKKYHKPKNKKALKKWRINMKKARTKSKTSAALGKWRKSMNVRHQNQIKDKDGKVRGRNKNALNTKAEKE